MMTEKPSLTAALETRTQPAEARNIFELLAREKPTLAKRLPRGIAWDWFEGAVRGEIQRNPKLMECVPASLGKAVVQALQLGLAPGELGHCYFAPFKDKKAGVTLVQFILGYRGIIHLSHDSGKLKDIDTGIVYEGDEFAFRKGTRPFLDHTPTGPPGERSYTHVYAVARLKTGGVELEVCYPADIDKAKSLSPTGSRNVGPWVDHWAQMARKTPVRRLKDRLPLSPQFMRALTRDEEIVDDDLTTLDETADVVIEG